MSAEINKNNPDWLTGVLEKSSQRRELPVRLLGDVQRIADNYLGAEQRGDARDENGFVINKVLGGGYSVRESSRHTSPYDAMREIGEEVPRFDALPKTEAELVQAFGAAKEELAGELEASLSTVKLFDEIVKDCLAYVKTEVDMIYGADRGAEKG